MAGIWFLIIVVTAILTVRRGMVWAVAACFVVSIFQAAAALSLGSLYMQPAYVYLLILCGVVAWRSLAQRELQWLFHAARLNLLVLLFGVWCVVSSIVMPRIFEGQVIVFPLQSSLFAGEELARYYLRPEPTNINQSIYAVLCLLICIVTAYATASEGLLSPIRKAIAWAVGIVCGIGLVQWCVRFAGMTFEPALLYNNKGVAVLTDQNFGAIPRLNVTYIEPSSLAQGLSPLVGYLMCVALIDKKARKLGILGLTGALILILSTSTTAYLGLAFTVFAVLVTLAVHQRGRFLPAALATVVGVALVLTVLGAFAWFQFPAIQEPVERIFTATVVDKGISTSAIERGSWNQQALRNFIDTYGIGVGFGSIRSSGLVFMLLGSVGLIGSVLFVAIVVQAIWPGRHDSGVWSPDLAGLKAGTLTSALTLAASGSELTSMPLWLMIGALTVNRIASASATNANFVGFSDERREPADPHPVQWPSDGAAASSRVSGL